MKKRFLILILLLALVIVTYVLLRHPVQAPINSEQPHTAQPTNVLPAITQVEPFTTLMSASNQAVTNLLTLSETKRRKVFEQYVETHNAPIDFYGRFIDQDNKPVPGVSIKMSVSSFVMSPDPLLPAVGKKFTPLERTSDVDGRFEVHDETGGGIGIATITKDGYLLSPKIPSGFGSSSGSFENPVIFKMWKKGPEEHLISGSHVFGIDLGKIYTLNLITGRKFEGEGEGDLLVSIVRPPDAKPRDRYQWSFSIEAIQGGFIEPDPDDEFMYIAPDSVYRPNIQMQFEPTNTSWSPVANERFFFCSRNGQVYGRVEIEVDSIYNVHSAIQIRYTLNPNGSRNLQP